jgi:peptidyl-dipeptidase Dcp
MSEILAASEDASNPFLLPFETEHGIPPFSKIHHGHYEPAFEVALKEHLQDIKNIAESSDEATFANTIAAFDRSGSMLNRISLVFYNLCSSDNPPELQAVQTKMAGPLAAHSSAIYM